MGPQYAQAPPPPIKKFDQGKFYRFINVLEIILRIVYGAVKGIKEAGPELIAASQGAKATPEQLLQQYGPGGQG
jgi:hypothetical protein